MIGVRKIVSSLGLLILLMGWQGALKAEEVKPTAFQLYHSFDLLTALSQQPNSRILYDLEASCMRNMHDLVGSSTGQPYKLRVGEITTSLENGDNYIALSVFTEGDAPILKITEYTDNDSYLNVSDFKIAQDDKKAWYPTHKQDGEKWVSLSSVGTAMASCAEQTKLQDVFKNFNLRSIRSSLGPMLKSQCGNSLHDVIEWGASPFYILKFTDDAIELEIQSRYITMRLSEEDGQDIMTFMSDFKQGTYFAETTYRIKKDATSYMWEATSELVNDQWQPIDGGKKIDSECAS